LAGKPQKRIVRLWRIHHGDPFRKPSAVLYITWAIPDRWLEYDHFVVEALYTGEDRVVLSITPVRESRRVEAIPAR